MWENRAKLLTVLLRLTFTHMSDEAVGQVFTVEPLLGSLLSLGIDWLLYDSYFIPK